MQEHTRIQEENLPLEVGHDEAWSLFSRSLCFSRHKYSRRADLADFLPRPCWEQVHWNVGVVCHLEGRVAITTRDQRTLLTDLQHFRKKSQ